MTTIMTRRARAAPTAMGTILLSGISCPHTRGAGEREGGWEGGKVSEDGGRKKIEVGKEKRGGGGKEQRRKQWKRRGGRKRGWLTVSKSVHHRYHLD